ncbi:MAG: hypothetical protein BWZ10_03045 [candidate division BRC1 bacterium ADurb.BinA364]|nr:MAG: hypothetical protein BWZ10_03045 [candidate division BRC1 bacterium ADurb.BinA364]
MPAIHAVQKIASLAAKFVVEQEGKWNHDDWEGLLQKAAKIGLELNSETERNLGMLAESAKHFYLHPPKKKAAAGPAKAVAKRAAKGERARA